jgi:hypothetical protein
VDFAPFPFVLILIMLGFWFLLGLAFLMIAARIVTRAVLDEIANDRRRRGPS